MKKILQNMMAVIYIRVSSNEQVDGTSLEDQEEKCRRFCEEKGMDYVIFREEGESAKTSDRTEFLRALEYCRKNKGKVSAFVVIKVDRFARNTEDHFAVRKILLDYGVTLHSVTEPIGNDPAGKFVETVLAGAAEFDNAIRSQRSVDGMIKRVRQGICPWKPPVGYESNQAKKRGEKKNEPDRPDKDIFPIIQRALKKFVAGEIPQAEFASYLDDLGLARLRERKTTKQMVDKILGQYLKFYAGIIENPWVEGEEVKGLHKPMITEGEMHMIIAIRAGKSIKKQPRQSFNPLFPLKKTIKCGTCGGNMTGSKSKGNGGYFPYYNCYNKDCEMCNKTIAKEDVEAEFVELLKTLKPKKKFLRLFKETVLDLWEEKLADYRAEVRKYEERLKQLEKKRKRIYEMREDGSYTQEEFQERKGVVDNEIAAAKISLSESRIEEFDLESVLTYALSFIEQLDRQWIDLRDENLLRFQQLIFPEGIPYFKGEGFGTAKMSLILELKETSHDEKSLLVTPRGIEPRFPP